MTRDSVSIRRVLHLTALLLGAALLLTAMEIGQYYLRNKAFGDQSWMGEPEMLVETISSILPSWLITAFLAPFVIFGAEKVRLERGRMVGSVVFHIFAAFVFALLHLAGTGGVAAAAYGASRFEPVFARLLALYLVYDFICYWTILAITQTIYYYRETREREVAASRLQASLTEARLTALQAQLNPHFLFNTLNAISTLALKGDNDAVVRMLDRLGSLLRLTLDGSSQELVLARELQLTDLYLDIQQTRFGHRLAVRKNISAETLDAVVPALLVQPLVENAIVHGIARIPGPGEISISASRTGDSLMLEVTDTGPGFRDLTPREGVGLSNTRARLEQLYGANHRIAFGSSSGGGASVTVVIPFRRRQEDAA
jgi:signal transduction histidine kinase